VLPPGLPPWAVAGYPICKIWPSKPPRGHVYCEASLLHHPIVSPTASKDWTGSPPLWFASGQEQLVDPVKVIAQTAFEQGVSVSFQEYEAMPHIFMWYFPDSPQAQKCWADWADTCKILVQGGSIPSVGTFVHARGMQISHLDLKTLAPFTIDAARSLMRKASNRFETFTGPKATITKL